MPELPEVETIRQYLIKDLIDKNIKKIEVNVPKQFIGNKNEIINKRIVDIQRKGKIIVIKLVNPKTRKPTNYLFLNIHLKLTGQLVFAKKINQKYKDIIPHTKSQILPAKTTHITIYFTDDSILYFNDLRKFGWMKLTNKPEIPKGVDILSKKFTLEFFTDLTDLINKPIKLLLLDQDKLAGIGNIYANDALFLANIHPLRKSNNLLKNEQEKLFYAIKKVIKLGLKFNGASDQSYILPNAQSGKYQDHLQVYGREKLPCLICKTQIKRIKHHGRSSFYCPKCQKI